MSITQPGASGAQVPAHSPLPGQRMVQLPWQTTSQPPEPVQLIVLCGPTSTAHGPEPVQAVTQPVPHMNEQAPEPAQCRLQSPRQFTRQSPLLGQTQELPRHSQALPMQLVADEQPPSVVVNAAQIGDSLE